MAVPKVIMVTLVLALFAFADSDDFIEGGMRLAKRGVSYLLF
jgi:hypothetical protein